MPQFAATIKHITDGLTDWTLSAAVKNIEGWEETLKDVDAPGAKAIVKDLESLKTHLGGSNLDGKAIGALVAKLGKETVALAKHGEGESAEKIKNLGEALAQAAGKLG